MQQYTNTIWLQIVLVGNKQRKQSSLQLFMAKNLKTPPKRQTRASQKLNRSPAKKKEPKQAISARSKAVKKEAVLPQKAKASRKALTAEKANQKIGSAHFTEALSAQRRGKETPGALKPSSLKKQAKAPQMEIDSLISSEGSSSDVSGIEEESSRVQSKQDAMEVVETLSETSHLKNELPGYKVKTLVDLALGESCPMIDFGTEAQKKLSNIFNFFIKTCTSQYKLLNEMEFKEEELKTLESYEERFIRACAFGKTAEIIEVVIETFVMVLDLFDCEEDSTDLTSKVRESWKDICADNDVKEASIQLQKITFLVRGDFLDWVNNNKAPDGLYRLDQQKVSITRKKQTADKKSTSSSPVKRGSNTIWAPKQDKSTLGVDSDRDIVMRALGSKQSWKSYYSDFFKLGFHSKGFISTADLYKLFPPTTQLNDVNTERLRLNLAEAVKYWKNLPNVIDFIKVSHSDDLSEWFDAVEGIPTQLDNSSWSHELTQSFQNWVRQLSTTNREEFMISSFNPTPTYMLTQEGQIHSILKREPGLIDFNFELNSFVQILRLVLNRQKLSVWAKERIILFLKEELCITQVCTKEPELVLKFFGWSKYFEELQELQTKGLISQNFAEGVVLQLEWFKQRKIELTYYVLCELLKSKLTMKQRLGLYLSEDLIDCLPNFSKDDAIFLLQNLSRFQLSQTQPLRVIKSTQQAVLLMKYVRWLVSEEKGDKFQGSLHDLTSCLQNLPDQVPAAWSLNLKQWSVLAEKKSGFSEVNNIPLTDYISMLTDYSIGADIKPNKSWFSVVEKQRHLDGKIHYTFGPRRFKEHMPKSDYTFTNSHCYAFMTLSPNMWQHPNPMIYDLPTGNGKSWLITLFVKGLKLQQQSKPVHVATSSVYLAKRDLHRFQKYTQLDWETYEKGGYWYLDNLIKACSRRENASFILILDEFDYFITEKIFAVFEDEEGNPEPPYFTPYFQFISQNQCYAFTGSSNISRNRIRLENCFPKCNLLAFPCYKINQEENQTEYEPEFTWLQLPTNESFKVYFAKLWSQVKNATRDRPLIVVAETQLNQSIIEMEINRSNSQLKIVSLKTEGGNISDDEVKTQFEVMRNFGDGIVVVVTKDAGRGIDFLFKSGCATTYVVLTYTEGDARNLKQLVGRSNRQSHQKRPMYAMPYHKATCEILQDETEDAVTSVKYEKDGAIKFLQQVSKLVNDLSEKKEILSIKSAIKALRDPQGGIVTMETWHNQLAKEGTWEFIDKETYCKKGICFCSQTGLPLARKPATPMKTLMEFDTEAL